MSMICDKCNACPTSPDMCVHEKKCPEYAGGLDAQKLRKRLHGAQLFMHSDLVLTLLPKSQQTREPEVVGINKQEDGYMYYVVRWFYPGVTLTFERATVQHPDYGMVSLYAVQKIEENNDKPNPTKRPKTGRRPSGRPSQRNRHHGNKPR